MDMYEYCSMFLLLGNEVEEETRGEEKNSIKKSYRKLIQQTIYYDLDENGSVYEDIKETNLDARIYASYQSGEYQYYVHPNTCLAEMAPFFVRLGMKGWEVVEYKFSTSNYHFCQALLKRRIVVREQEPGGNE